MSYIENSSQKSRAEWDVIRETQGTNKRARNMTLLNNIPRRKRESDEQILTNVNLHYSNACKPKSTNTNFEPTSIRNNNETLFLYPPDPQEILSTILSLKNTKSVGPNGIPTIVLKHVVKYIAQPLSFIVNMSMHCRIFPDLLKNARIKAVYKKGDKAKVENYRSIAVLNVLSKIFGKIIYERFMAFLEKHSILHEAQNEFRRGRSTIRAVYEALYDIMKSLNDGKRTLSMCVDLSKAFDCVNDMVYGVQPQNLCHHIPKIEDSLFPR
ncbi:hypothetical protein HHI36_000325 [Cryptolaemus montrouzieri]|uniref:Reverse transcriptase domain-containing protein n=1 Tax=Cryptolaemus montrouzieri TaxID=559131 RepID=A0ABD2P4A4_9CUCU